MLSSYFRSSINQPPEITTIQFNTCVEERKKKHDCLLAVIETCADFASLYVLLLVLFLFSFFFFFFGLFPVLESDAWLEMQMHAWDFEESKKGGLNWDQTNANNQRLSDFDSETMTAQV